MKIWIFLFFGESLGNPLPAQSLGLEMASCLEPRILGLVRVVTWAPLCPIFFLMSILLLNETLELYARWLLP